MSEKVNEGKTVYLWEIDNSEFDKIVIDHFCDCNQWLPKGTKVCPNCGGNIAGIKIPYVDGIFANE